ncbi:Steadiness box [Artemisia annua]|uniref:Steadiness box n=1 Tax=Artemisia annua TaxID=35608 RepID=A0A2U1KV97_ARTAN|nr:Steadiness box [Artemisia annua]
MNTDVLEAWVKENEGKFSVGGAEGVCGDEVFEPVDGLSKQMLECTTFDLAIEDLFKKAIPVDVYLRNVRLLLREQFVHRATSMKVGAAQIQAQVTRCLDLVLMVVLRSPGSCSEIYTTLQVCLEDIEAF